MVTKHDATRLHHDTVHVILSLFATIGHPTHRFSNKWTIQILFMNSLRVSAVSLTNFFEKNMRLKFPQTLLLQLHFGLAMTKNKLNTVFKVVSCSGLCLSQNYPTKKKFQLRAIISTMSGQDSLVDVGTGNGKTLCMIIPCLLSQKTISIIISLLKRLQAVQGLEFERYHVKTVAINEDTPNDPELSKV